MMYLIHPLSTHKSLAQNQPIKSREVNKLSQHLLHPGEKECIPSNFFRACRTLYIANKAPFIAQSQSLLVKVLAQPTVGGGLIHALRMWKISPSKKKVNSIGVHDFFLFFLSFITQQTVQSDRQVKLYSGKTLLFLKSTINTEFKQYSG